MEATLSGQPFVLGLSVEDSREVFESTFPELAHISLRSSLEERRIALRKLNMRLGIPADSGAPTV